MSKRTIMEIDQDICDGCGACATGCPEGALRIIEGKARLVGESLCDGLGACIGTCPKGAIHVVEREADEYDEISVLKEILPQGPAVLAAHFAHLDHHGQDLYLDKAVRLPPLARDGYSPGIRRVRAKRNPLPLPSPAAPCPASRPTFGQRPPARQRSAATSRVPPPDRGRSIAFLSRSAFGRIEA